MQLKEADTYFSQTIKRALVTFAIARTLNAAISAFQDSEVVISPTGIGATLSVGEILDPLNDLVERFSWVMLISTTSLGIQKIFMEIGVWFGFKILLSFSMSIILIGIWIPRISNVSLMSLGYKLIIVAIVIRFCIPLIASILKLKSPFHLSQIKRFLLCFSNTSESVLIW